MAAIDSLLIEKIRGLPAQRAAEVEDFVNFLRAREENRGLTCAAANASEPSFSQVWENYEDPAYNRI
jgi:hypothetical protein